MTELRPKTVLNEDLFPIMGWPGPCEALIKDDVMRDMAEAGFTLSYSSPSLGKRLEALDTAYRNGVRLVLQDPAYHVTDDYRLTDERRRQVEEVVEEVKGHPGLYGYYLRDEPWAPLFPVLAEVKELIDSLDPYHLKYINHFPPRQTGWNAGSMELFWLNYVETVKPAFLSYDHYIITIVTRRELDSRDPADPTYLPRYKIRIKPDYFDALDITRSFSQRFGLPFWAFTMSVRHGWYPTPTEGHTRYQLMHDLAYGALGLQYFTYSNGGLIDHKGERTEMWYIARKVNREVHTWAPTLRKLRSIAVYHTGPFWSGTRALKPDVSQNLGIDCEGDPVTIGFFHDPEKTLHLLIVNKNPCDWARIALKVKLEEKEDILEISPITGSVDTPWPYSRERLELVLAPGEGRLFRIGGKG